MELRQMRISSSTFTHCVMHSRKLTSFRAIDNIASFIQPIVDQIAEKYGWTACLFMAGQIPGSDQVGVRS